MGSPGCDRETQLLAAARKIDALMRKFEREFDEYFQIGRLDDAASRSDLSELIEGREILYAALEPFDDERERSVKLWRLSSLLYEFGCWVRVDDGTLLSAPQQLDGEFPALDEWCEVSNPESEAFLDAVNVAFRTHFKLSEFSGR